MRQSSAAYLGASGCGGNSGARSVHSGGPEVRRGLLDPREAAAPGRQRAFAAQLLARAA